jgi:hypothetical protein
MDIREHLQDILMENEEVMELPESVIPLLKEAFMHGFMASSQEFNGKEAAVVYKESQLKPGSQLWEKYLNERFNRFMNRIKRYGYQKHE